MADLGDGLRARVDQLEQQLTDRRRALLNAYLAGVALGVLLGLLIGAS